MQPQNTNDPYGFIMNSPQKQANKPIGMGARIAVVAGGVLLLIIVAIIGNSLLSSGQKAQTQRYIELAQTQTEIIRITTLADKKAKTLNTRSYAVTTRVSLESSQKSTTAILNKRGIKEKKLTKLLSASKNPKTDAALEEATKNNRFDETFNKLLNTQLANYQKQLNDAASGASKKDKQALQRSFNQVAILTKKVDAPTPQETTVEDSTDSSDTSADESDSSIIDNSVGSDDSEL